MERNINIIWNVLSVILENNFTFSNIKQLVSLSGLDRTLLSHLEQSNNSTKGHLINAIDNIIKDYSREDIKHFLAILVEEILSKKNELELDISRYLEKLGWSLHKGEIIPIDLFDPSELSEMNEVSHIDLIKAATRFRDGDLSGAITSSCAAIDNLTNSIYKDYSLGNPNIASFQERCNQSIIAVKLYDSIEEDLLVLGWVESDIAHFKKNLKDSLNKMALVTQKLRSGMGDVHGTKPVLKSLVYDCMKFSQILVSLMSR